MVAWHQKFFSQQTEKHEKGNETKISFFSSNSLFCVDKNRLKFYFFWELWSHKLSLLTCNEDEAYYELIMKKLTIYEWEWKNYLNKNPSYDLESYNINLQQ